MEKYKPHSHLPTIQSLARQGAIRVVGVAMRDALSLGFDREDIVDVILSLSNKDFYKSMTAYDDPTCWHDVYRPISAAGQLYIKLILHDNVIVVSFKEK